MKCYSKMQIAFYREMKAGYMINNYRVMRSEVQSELQLAEKLGREAYKSYILVRFDQTTEDIEDLFPVYGKELISLFHTHFFGYAAGQELG